MNNKHSFSSLFIYLSFTSLLLLLSACSNNASHLPSPFELPGAIIGSVFENTRHNARQRRVEAYVTQHYLDIRQDVKKGGGKALEGALNAAKIKAAKRDATKKDFITNQDVYFKNTVAVADALINNFASLYVSTSKADKRINGFTYTEARLVIKDYARQNFEPLRLAIQQGQGDGLEQLASRLNINDAAKRTQFIQKAKPLYKRIYLDLVVVVLMVYSN